MRLIAKNYMKYFGIILIFCLTVVSSQDSLAQSSKKFAKRMSKNGIQYEAYQGKWFGLYFPRDWRVTPSQKDTSSGADDSVFFTAPDNTAEFYVYCPRYTGKPKDVEINRLVENQLGQTLEEAEGVRIRTVRIQAKDSSYVRFIEDTEAFIKSRRLVFGVKFVGQEAIKKYNPSYMHFKQSFRKFAD
jgi:hypothetical protein